MLPENKEFFIKRLLVIGFHRDSGSVQTCNTPSSVPTIKKYSSDSKREGGRDGEREREEGGMRHRGLQVCHLHATAWRSRRHDLPSERWSRPLADPMLDEQSLSHRCRHRRASSHRSSTEDTQC
jgi:hypothetical protein